jgi:competence ComEA-like helix-hairpin-helix protein
MTISISKLARWLASFGAVALLIAAMGGTWSRSAVAAPTAAAATSSAATSPASTSPASPSTGPTPHQAVTRPSGAQPTSGTQVPSDEVEEPPAKKSSHKQLSGKLNLNTANEDQLMLLPTVGPAKAERIVTWRKKNGAFKRVADLRRVKGFGYKTFKKLEPFLDIKGDTTLAPK